MARGVALDQRFAAAVCDGGIWDLHERRFLMERMPPFAAEIGSGIARRFKCPVLVTVGEDGWLEAGRVQELFEKLKRNHRDITLKLFLREETAASQGHFDNPTLANEFIFDWIAERLDIDAGQRDLPVQIPSTRSKSPAF